MYYNKAVGENQVEIIRNRTRVNTSKYRRGSEVHMYNKVQFRAITTYHPRGRSEG